MISCVLESKYAKKNATCKYLSRDFNTFPLFQADTLVTLKIQAQIYKMNQDSNI